MKADEQLKCKDCDWYGSCEYYHNRKETSQICKMFNNTWKFIAELEKIKGKIIINNNFEWVFSGRKFIEKKAILDIIDKEISELKGENKE